jgi:hypothetical protein
LYAGEPFFTEENWVRLTEMVKEEQTDEVLQGESVNLREPLDLTEVQGIYDEVFSRGSKLRRDRTADPSHEDRWIYAWILISEFRKLKSVNLVTGIAIFRYAISQHSRIVWGGHRS